MLIEYRCTWTNLLTHLGVSMSVAKFICCNADLKF